MEFHHHAGFIIATILLLRVGPVRGLSHHELPFLAKNTTFPEGTPQFTRQAVSLGVRRGDDQRRFPIANRFQIIGDKHSVPVVGYGLDDGTHLVQAVETLSRADGGATADFLHGLSVCRAFLALYLRQLGAPDPCLGFKEAHTVPGLYRGMLPVIAGQNDSAFLLPGNFKQALHRTRREHARFIDPQDLSARFALKLFIDQKAFQSLRVSETLGTQYAATNCRGSK